MAHFAKVENGVVTQVLVINQEEINTGNWGDPAQWVQTSYNTYKGVYHTPGTGVPDPDQSKALRKNFAGIGMVWDAERDMFYSRQPYPSWTLDEQTGTWVPPVALDVPPEDAGHYGWDEVEQKWVDRWV